MELYESENDTTHEINLSEQHPDNEQEKKYIIRNMWDEELHAYCQKEIKAVETLLLERFECLGSENFKARDLLKDDKFTKQIIGLAYRWRSSNAILAIRGKALLNEKLVSVKLFSSLTCQIEQ
jgi:hypothetical protein